MADIQKTQSGGPDDTSSVVSGVSQGRRARVLLSAFTCSPYYGSEPGVGWHTVSQVARFFDVWVIACENEPEIRRWVRENGDIPTLHFHFLPLNHREKMLAKLPGMTFAAYQLWQRRAYHLALRLEREHRFDLVHQVNLTSFREPGYLWKLDHLPFVWGPMGGMENYPWRFLPQAGLIGASRELIRNVANSLQFRLSPRVRKATRRSSALLTVNSLGARRFAKYHQVNSLPMLDLGTLPVKPEVPERGRRRGPLRILWSSSFQHRKALHLLIGALARLPADFAYELKILGRGALEKRWRRLARKAGIEAHCCWTSQLPYKEALAQYAWADVLVFTSLRDGCGSVGPEALNHGLPVICFDHQGVGDVVTETCGIKVPLTFPEETISKLAEAILELGRNREKLDELAQGALQRSRDFQWNRKGDQIAAVYGRILAAHPRPGEMNAAGWKNA